MTDIAIPARRFWPAALVKHEHELDELEIPRIPRRVRSAPTVARIEAIMALPAYWKGAMFTRQGDTGRGLLLCAQIERDLIAGKALSECDGFREWREGVR
jgi:hypothetical protein